MNLFQPLEHVSHGQYFIFHTEATLLFGDEQATDVTELSCLRQKNCLQGLHAINKGINTGVLMTPSHGVSIKTPQGVCGNF